MFENEVVQFRKLTPGDHVIYNTWRNDMDVMKSTSPSLDLYSLEETERFITMISSQPDAKGYIIIDKKTGEDVGIISLINIDYKNRSTEFIIDIGAKNIWGKGIGTKSISLILEYAFDELNLNRVYLQVFSFNERAISLYEKMGFSHEGRAREGIYRGGKWYDIVNMGILKSEYDNK